jgi:rubrerythrin
MDGPGAKTRLLSLAMKPESAATKGYKYSTGLVNSKKCRITNKTLREQAIRKTTCA